MTYTPLTSAQRTARRVGAAVDALDLRVRLKVAQTLLRAGDTPQAQALWRAVYMLTEGATPERLEHLVSVLEVAGSELVEGVRRHAGQAARGGGPLAHFWLELSHLAREVQRGNL